MNPSTLHAPPVALLPATPLLRAPRPETGRRPELGPTERRWLVAGVAGLHLLLLWALLQVGALRQALRDVAPRMLEVIPIEAPLTPAPPPPPPPPRVQRVPPPNAAPRPVVMAVPTPQPPPVEAAVVVPGPTPPQANQVPPAPPAPVTAPTPQPAAAPRPVAASALRYAVLPAVEMPLASRRLGESGTVLLRVVFDTRGHLKQASVHRSSGHARLDEQALAAMRQARITPFLESGQPIEISAIAPLAYELD